MAALSNLTKIAKQNRDKEDLQFRYKPRTGPLASPEPEFATPIDLLSQFNVDPAKGSISRAEEKIAVYIDEFYHTMEHRFHYVAHDMQDRTILEHRDLGIIEWQVFVFI